MKNKIFVRLMRIMCLTQFTRFILIFLYKFFNKKKKILNSVSSENIISNTDLIINEIIKNGYSSNIIVPSHLIDEIVQYLNNNKFTAQEGEGEFTISYNNPQKPSNSLWYGNYEVLKDCEALKKIVFNEGVLKVCEAYLGTKPTLIGSHCWWSFPPSKEGFNHQYGFHYDIDSPKFLKFFIYLNDVDEETGPHIIIEKTHKRKTIFEKFNRRLPDKIVKSQRRYKNLVIKTGPKGSMFFEDTFSYHKGTTPKKPRLILQAEYSI